jgi:hypothetical protein
MGNENDIRIVLGSKRFAGSTDKDVSLQVPLIGTRRTMVEGDRSIVVDAEERFNLERQGSSSFRISGKLTNIFNNSITGKTTYTPYVNNLYYTNPVANALSLPNSPWEGYPQFDEFSAFRTTGITGHINYVPKSANTYNWAYYVSYAYSSTTAQTMSYTNENFSVTNTFNVEQGIPFVLENRVVGGRSLVYFYCGGNHNLQPNDYVELNININNRNTFQVYSLGDENYGTEKNVFTIYDMKFPTNDILPGTFGNFKRITNIKNSAETKSRYYVRLHKILTDAKDCNITKAGFENNPFFSKKKLEYSAITPNQIQRISTKENNQTYSFNIVKDVNITGLKDNNGKPLTELFITMINRGYFGFFNQPPVGQNTAIDIGWGFNFLKNTYDSWWDHTSTNNKDNIPVGNYSTNGLTFYYNELLNVGDTIKGDFCEYNDYEQKEYVISDLFHKYSFNYNLFYDNSPINEPSGYLYKPHNSIKIRTFSDYLEFGSANEVDNIPQYAWYSQYEESFFWRDLYGYGYIDGDNIGVNNPFTNGSHYPFKTILFSQYPIKRSTSVQTTLITPIINDNCE